MLESLTKGEWRVVDLVARGWTNQEVADELGLRVKTVEWTLTNVYRKLHLRSRTELAVKVAGLGRPSNPGISLDVERQADDTPAVEGMPAGCNREDTRGATVFQPHRTEQAVMARNVRGRHSNGEEEQ